MRIMFICILAIFAATAKAETNASVGYVAGSNKGIELALGLYDSIGPIAFKLNYLDFVFHPSRADQRYQLQKVSKYSSVCTDPSTGQTADMPNCYPVGKIEYAPNLQLLFQILPATSIGAAYRGGDLAGPYAVLQWRFYNKGYLGIGYGPDYSAAMFGLIY